MQRAHHCPGAILTRARIYSSRRAEGLINATFAARTLFSTNFKVRTWDCIEKKFMATTIHSDAVTKEVLLRGAGWNDGDTTGAALGPEINSQLILCSRSPYRYERPAPQILEHI